MDPTKNFGDQINQAVNAAINSQDFSGLQHAINSSVQIASANIASGLSRASETMRRVQEERLREQQQRQIELQMANLYQKSAGKAPGVLLAATGGLIAVPSLCLTAGLLIGSTLDVAATMGVLAISGAALLGFGIKKIKFANLFETYRNIIGLREHCFINEIAAATAQEPKQVLKNVKKMLKRGLFKQGALDDTESFLIMTRTAYAQYRQARAQAAQLQHQQDLAGSVSEAPTGNPANLSRDARELLERGEAYVAKIRLSNNDIADSQISRTIDQIEHVVRTIFCRASEHPEVIGDLDQMMDYYLPTTVKLLDAYRELDRQPIQGENLLSSKREIENALESFSVAFEKLLDSVFKDMAWDISTDVSVLHTVLAQEGLVNSPFNAK